MPTLSKIQRNLELWDLPSPMCGVLRSARLKHEAQQRLSTGNVSRHREKQEYSRQGVDFEDGFCKWSD